MQAGQINNLRHAISDFTSDESIDIAAGESEFMVHQGKQFIVKTIKQLK